MSKIEGEQEKIMKAFKKSLEAMCIGCGSNNILDDYGYCEDCTMDGTNKYIDSDDDIEFYCKENF